MPEEKSIGLKNLFWNRFGVFIATAGALVVIAGGVIAGARGLFQIPQDIKTLQSDTATLKVQTETCKQDHVRIDLLEADKKRDNEDHDLLIRAVSNLETQDKKLEAILNELHEYRNHTITTDSHR